MNAKKTILVPVLLTKEHVEGYVKAMRILCHPTRYNNFAVGYNALQRWCKAHEPKQNTN